MSNIGSTMLIGHSVFSGTGMYRRLFDIDHPMADCTLHVYTLMQMAKQHGLEWVETYESEDGIVPVEDTEKDEKPNPS